MYNLNKSEKKNYFLINVKSDVLNLTLSFKWLGKRTGVWVQNGLFCHRNICLVCILKYFV